MSPSCGLLRRVLEPVCRLARLAALRAVTMLNSLAIFALACVLDDTWNPAIWANWSGGKIVPRPPCSSFLRLRFHGESGPFNAREASGTHNGKCTCGIKCRSIVAVDCRPRLVAENRSAIDPRSDRGSLRPLASADLDFHPRAFPNRTRECGRRLRRFASDLDDRMNHPELFDHRHW